MRHAPEAEPAAQLAVHDRRHGGGGRPRPVPRVHGVREHDQLDALTDRRAEGTRSRWRSRRSWWAPGRCCAWPAQARESAWRWRPPRRAAGRSRRRRPRRATASGSVENARRSRAMKLRRDRGTSSTGARSTFTPSRRRYAPVRRPSARARSSDLICGGDTPGGPGSRLTAPPSWSTATSSADPPGGGTQPADRPRDRSPRPRKEDDAADLPAADAAQQRPTRPRSVEARDDPLPHEPAKRHLRRFAGRVPVRRIGGARRARRRRRERGGHQDRGGAARSHARASVLGPVPAAGRELHVRRATFARAGCHLKRNFCHRWRSGQQTRRVSPRPRGQSGDPIRWGESPPECGVAQEREPVSSPRRCRRRGGTVARRRPWRRAHRRVRHALFLALAAVVLLATATQAAAQQGVGPAWRGRRRSPTGP